MSRILVTGGLGFIGSAIVKRLLQDGHAVRVLDNSSRGSQQRLADVKGEYSFYKGDVCNIADVFAAVRGVDAVYHLACINGTRNFYSAPTTVLQVGVKGIVNVLDACLQHDVGTLVLASSSEVYNEPSRIPTPEDVPLVIPDPHNPRYSYAGVKIISELMTLQYAQEGLLERALIFRPHNVYGPDMGIDHVIPELTLKMYHARNYQPTGVLEIPVQGTGEETRSFCYIDDLVSGVMRMQEIDMHTGIYNTGTPHQTTIQQLAKCIAEQLGYEIKVVPTNEVPVGSPTRRCPDTTKLESFGWKPKVSLSEGLARTVEWYVNNPV